MDSSDHRSNSPILVMKFGGTSVAGEAGLSKVAGLVQAAASGQRVLLVASAMAGVTDLLVAGANRAKGIQEVLEGYGPVHRGALAALAPAFSPEQARALEKRLDGLEEELSRLLQGVNLLGDCSPHVLARICALGERASCALLAGLLEARGLPCLLLDPIRVLVCKGNPLEASPLPARIREALAPFRLGAQPLALLPGFFGGNEAGEPVLLGRGGSDLSAALMAAAVDASLLEIWTDVDGVFTADPRLVENAQCLEELSYEEAMELAYFGAKVLHPRTLGYVRGPRIPTRVRNTQRPEHPGTLVTAEAVPSDDLPRGLTLLPGLALLDLSGSGLRGVPGVAARAFGSLAGRGVNVVLITQGSSECAHHHLRARRGGRRGPGRPGSHLRGGTGGRAHGSAGAQARPRGGERGGRRHGPLHGRLAGSFFEAIGGQGEQIQRRRRP